MQKSFITAIVGGGAAGLLSAIELLNGSDALSGSEVVILEKNDRVGKKLIATGNGQGNLTNANVSEEFFYGDKAFIKAFLESEKSIDLKNYLRALGVPLCESKDGKIYPLSKQASAVLDILRAYLQYKNCTVITGEAVEKIIKTKSGYKILTAKDEYYARSVIMATGGSAGKQFGTDGSAYALAENLGHKRTEVYPSLVQLKTQTDLIRSLKGLKETAKVTAYSGETALKSAVGDLLFTEFGVSGSAIFTVSAAVAGKKNVKLKIEFLPELSIFETEKIIAERQNLRYFAPEDALSGILNKRVGQAVLKTAKSKKATDIAYALKNFTLSVTGSLGFNYAQVTRGGISTDKVNSKTFESKLNENFYIVGEALDIDGDCGGYNLTFAFVSGIVAARDIKEKLSKK